VPYLSALEVYSRQGAIQIHIYLYLYLDIIHLLESHTAHKHKTVLSNIVRRVPSVCLSVTLLIFAQTIQDIEISFTSYDKAMFLVSCIAEFRSREFRSSPNRVC